MFVYAPSVIVVVDVDGGAGDVVSQLDGSLRSDPRLAGVDIQRGRAEVRQGDLGGHDVLTFLATDVMLPLVLSAIYDFFKARLRSRPGERVRVRLRRTDLPDGTRQTELALDGPGDVVLAAVRQALEGSTGAGE